jgi:3-hydroxyacyl-[acyl-carrier-protein] dehydratase
MYQEGEAQKIGFFASIDNCRFKRQVRPGDQLVLSFEVTRARGPFVKGKGIATVNGDTACEADIMFALGDK